MPQQTTKQFVGCFNGRELSYTASLDLVPVADTKGNQVGTCSVFSYVADAHEDDRTARPVTFLFNGGPGAASCFLHFGGLGVRRVVVPEDLSKGLHGPYVLADNEHSCFDSTDLVFIDPMNAGFGRSNADVSLDRIYSVEGDADAFAQIIKKWLGQNRRWNSPKYIGGESYGTHRAAFLATTLMGFGGVPLDGILLFGQAINVQETLERPGNLTGLIAGIPYKAATAWFHGKGAKECASAEEATRMGLQFANGEFAQAMLKGNLLSEDEKKTLASQLEKLTGISSDFNLKNRFWVSKAMFRKELLKESSTVLGAYDSRYISPAADSASGENDADSSVSYILPGLTATFDTYLRDELGVQMDIEYRVLDSAAAAQWDWTDNRTKKHMMMGKASPFDTYPYVSRLTEFMRQTPQARLFIGTGLYDGLATVGAVEQLLRTFDIDRTRVTERWYDGGHMMYTNPHASQALNQDIRDFIATRSST